VNIISAFADKDSITHFIHKYQPICEKIHGNFRAGESAYCDDVRPGGCERGKGMRFDAEGRIVTLNM
jgi:hypothetical protein